MYKIPFNRPPYTGNEDRYVLEAMRSDKISGDGAFARQCEAWLDRAIGGGSRTMLTPSCTHALDMSALLLDIQPGDEVIMPSYTFVSTANAFVLRGAKIVFVDIRPDTMNIDEKLVEQAVTPRTRVIVPVHYAGVGCEMDTILAVAERHGLHVVEDAAQGMLATYRGHPLGGFGCLSAYSFHETKNFTSGGEGGLLIVNDGRHHKRAEIIREKGTNRSQFFRGMVDKYTWVDTGSSFLPSEIQAAYLWGQLQVAQEITAARRTTWNRYRDGLADLARDGRIEVPTVPAHCEHNGHMFYMKVRDLGERTALLKSLKEDGILAVFHYVPLHSAPAGLVHGRFSGEDRWTTRESERLVRLPLWYGMTDAQVDEVIGSVRRFFGA